MVECSINTNLNVPVWFCQRFKRHSQIVVIWEGDCVPVWIEITKMFYRLIIPAQFYS